MMGVPGETSIPDGVNLMGDPSMIPEPPPGSVVRTEGPTRNGGVATVSYDMDDANRLVPKDRATRVMIYELDEKDDVIHRTSETWKRPSGDPGETP
jgi:hypothetical protein